MKILHSILKFALFVLSVTFLSLVAAFFLSVFKRQEVIDAIELFRTLF